MMLLRYDFRRDWLFYLFLLSYAYLIIRMTLGLWSPEGVNVFATYSDAPTAAAMIIDANKVYWSKTWFLFGTLLLVGLNVEFRTAVGIAAVFWSGSLTLMFGATPPLVATLVMGTLLVIQQTRRGQLLGQPV